ncbi:MAG: hypothetical protein LC624_07135 [Halobacteriales archaeon]|nr:hypothetical protein [Halobacteriales archaeon]
MPGLPCVLLGLEGRCVAAPCLAGYLVLGGPWWGPASFLVPDLGLLDHGPRAGSSTSAGTSRSATA